MTGKRSEEGDRYKDEVSHYDSDLDDPDDDTTGYENDADAQGDEAEEAE